MTALNEGGNFIWNPVYGKQLLFLSATSYFDIFFTMGAGLAFSDFYPEKTELSNGKIARDKSWNPDDATTQNQKPGASASETDSYGKEGRPVAESQTNLMFNLGIGQKYHFLKRFHIQAELRNYTLVGTDTGFDNFFTLWGGFGVRF